VKTTSTILILLAAATLAFYAGGYFFVVHKRLQNPFISWPIRTPKPVVEFYQPHALQVIYEPMVRLDKKLFPKRWVCPPTPNEEIAAVFKNIDLNRIFEMSKTTGSNGGSISSQPLGSYTNRTSATAASSRSP
jgi:hypothetical protein